MYWVNFHKRQLLEESAYEQVHFLRLKAELEEMRNEESIYALKKCDIVGITTTGAAKYRNLIKRLKPRVVIFEEAAEVLEAHVVTSLTIDTQHLILIGDPQQLRPNPTVTLMSLFERMVKNGLECHRLNIQHRMRPCIADLLVPHIYTDLENHDIVFCYECVKGIDKNMFFIDHDTYETENTEMKSHANDYEARFIIALGEYLILQGYNSSQITILTTYSGQLLLLKKLMEGNKILANVRTTIVDNFQGEENDIILISFVRSNRHGGVGFLKIANRICVALSRAKKGLYCIGNFKLLGESCDIWKKIQTKLLSGKHIGNSLKLNCQIHTETSTEVSSWEHFKDVPDGGCSRACGKKLLCGHVCRRKCHPVDVEHEDYECTERCSKVLCDKGHKCPQLCYMKCRPCKVLVRKTIPSCGHENDVPCYRKPDLWECVSPCLKTLPCGHICSATCGKCKSNFSCVECVKKVAIVAPCGHEVTVFCHLKSNLEAAQKACHIACKMKLGCGHICSGSCKTCSVIYNGMARKQHKICSKKCERALTCGHACKNACGDACSGVCYEMVEKKYSCGHERKIKCSELPTSKCNQPCMAILSCRHLCNGNCTQCKNGSSHVPCKIMVRQSLHCGHTVTTSCSDINSTQCKNPCLKILPCGHHCQEICSDLCTEQCNFVISVTKSCGHKVFSFCCKKNSDCYECSSKIVLSLNGASNFHADTSDYNYPDRFDMLD